MGSEENKDVYIRMRISEMQTVNIMGIMVKLRFHCKANWNGRAKRDNNNNNNPSKSQLHRRINTNDS